MPRELVSALSQHGIYTLGDVRDAGGTTPISGLSAAGGAAVKLLEAHAELSRLSPDLNANATLIAKGFTSALAIASASQENFVAATHETLGDFGAAQLHVAARAQVSVLNNILTDLMANPTDETIVGNSALTSVLRSIPGGGYNRCQCDDCQAAMSPAAYLADLLSYALRYVKNTIFVGVAPSVLGLLTDAYHQPFGDLPTDCDAVNTQVRQVRICVEVLRGHLKATTPSPDLDVAEKAYRLAAYTALLARLGTSWDEVRLARSASRQVREALAGRLGIGIVPLGSTRPDQLDGLFLDPGSSVPTAPDALTEDNLESLFGLVDTTRDPLSDGRTVIPGNLTGVDAAVAKETIKRWNLKGVEWGRNTDSDGKIYVRVAASATQGFCIAQLYRDPQLQDLVAEDEEAAGTPLTLAEKNDSGLSGQMIVSVIGTVSGIALAAMPRVTAWRLAHLRPMWEEEDRPTDPFREGLSVVALAALPAGVSIPQTFVQPLPLILPSGLGYDPANQALAFAGVMTPEEQIQRLATSPAAEYQTAIRSLFVQSQRPPMIDPDVIGPDDFRVPAAKSGSGADKAFDLWLKRRAWVDAQLIALEGVVTTVNGQVVPDFYRMIAAMYDTIGYGAGAAGWNNTTLPKEFASLQDDLMRGANVEAAKLRLASDLALTVDGFLQLMATWTKDQAGRLDPRVEVSPDEWREVRSILVQSQKTRLFPAWRTEEQPLGVPFSGTDFWISIGEPRSGAWPPVIPAGHPLIDPEIVKEADLPEATAGKAAFSIWRGRVDELEVSTAALRAEREKSGINGFDNIVTLALGPLQATLDQLNNNLQSETAAVVASATAIINDDLGMTIDAFNRLMTIKAKAGDSNALNRPNAAEWTEAYQILASAQKQKAFPAWIGKEAAESIFYWNALKAKLPPWRASAESRQAWQGALRNRNAPPIIDPDLINPGDLKHPVSGDAAFDIWSLRNQLGQIFATPTSLAELEALIVDQLGVAARDLESLEAAQAKGNSIDGRLNQLNLSAEALSQLLRVRALLNSNAPVIDSEWSDVYSILAQVVKTRQNATSRHAEAAAHITLSPDFFQIPEVVSYSPVEDDCPPPEPAPLPAWRASWTARQDWQDTLQSRIDQQNAVVLGVSQASDATEEATLAKLRDALVMASPANGTCVGEKAKALTRSLLIDTQQSCCLKTTRIAQALETLQILLWGSRTGEIEMPSQFAPINLGVDFDEEWKWMGSFATWRAAMLVWMFTENVLPPTLRRWQTPGFRRLVNNLRADSRLTPDQASDAACAYSDYFGDVCTLSERDANGILWRIEASCQTSTLIHEEGHCPSRAGADRRLLFYLFGRGGLTNKVYWSANDASDDSGYGQTFWDEVPGLGMENPVNLISAVAYESAPTRRILCLFARCLANGVQNLVLTKYDLESQVWDSDNHPLDLPANSATFDIVILARTLETDAVRVRIRSTSRLIYERQLNRDASGWAVGDWTPILPPWSSWFPVSNPAAAGTNNTITAVAQPGNPDRIDLFTVLEDGTVIWAWWDANDNSGQWQNWRPISPAGRARGPVTAVSRKINQIDIFTTDSTRGVWTAWWNPPNQGPWPWRQLGAAGLVSTQAVTVAAVTPGPSRLEIFAINNSGYVVTNWWDEDPGRGQWTAGWPGPSPTHTAITAGANYTEVTAVVCVGRIHLFTVDNNGAVWTTFRDQQWLPWVQISAPDTVNTGQATVTAIARSPSHIDLFAVGKDGAVSTTYWDADPYLGQWPDWFVISPAQLAGDSGVFGKVSVVSRNPNRLDLFVVGWSKFAKNWATSQWGVWSTFWDANIDNGAWHPWVQLNETDLLEFSDVAAVSRNPDQIDLFVVPGHVAESGVKRQAYSAVWQGVAWTGAGSVLVPPIRVAPDVANGPFEISEKLSSSDLQGRRSQVRKAFIDNQAGPPANLEYLEEAYYFVPIYLALQLQDQGYYTEALDWFRTVYDYSVSLSDRKIYYGLELEQKLPDVANRVPQWLLDPLNPHLIAATRRNTYTRYTILSIVHCMLDFADAEFTNDTAESNEQARTLYSTALALLDLLELGLSRVCQGLRINLDDEVLPIIEDSWRPVWNKLKRHIAGITDTKALAAVVPKLKTVMSEDSAWNVRFAKARSLVADAQAKSSLLPSLHVVLDDNTQLLAKAHPALCRDQSISQLADFARRLSSARFLAGASFASGIPPAALLSTKTQMPWLRSEQPSASSGANPTTPSAPGNMSDAVMATRATARTVPPLLSGNYDLLSPLEPERTPLPTVTQPPTFKPDMRSGPASTAVGPDFPTLAPSFWFCTPPNPLLIALRRHAKLSLFKLRNCLNIAGMHRELDPYSAPTDSSSGLPMISQSGQLVLPTTTAVRPTEYRYGTLIERAKQLVQTAAQMEASMLSAFEKRDSEAYNLLRARQDLRLTSANVQLSNLQINEALAGVQLARLQQDRARIQADHWQALLNTGISALEKGQLTLLANEAEFQLASGVASALSADVPSLESAASFGSSNTANIASSLSAFAAMSGTLASISGMSASYERRSEDWKFNRSLAEQDQEIAGAQISVAEDHVSVVQQQHYINQIQAGNATEVVDFLGTKFTNVELYVWMSGVLQRVYGFFLQQATSMAKLAENQLAFERQEVPAAFIQADYWTDPTNGGTSGNTTSGHTPDRRGLTGSARLLQDIYQLDQYAFQTNQRKLQLTKTISLQRQDPYEFARFCETGVMNFTTPMEMFDRDFPGHYLRLIRRVRTSVIALIPPTQGIRATLSTTAASRVVIGGNSGLFQNVVVRRDPQLVALSSPINATGLFELDAQSDLLMPFEGLGVDAHWEFRMPKAANLFDYNTIADALITVEYTAFDSFDYRQQVIQALKPRLSADVPYSFRNEFMDQWYDLHNPDQTSTPMTVRFSTLLDDFPPNIDDLRIQQVLLYFSRADGQLFEVSVSSLRFKEQGGPGAVGGAAATIDGTISTRRGNAGSWTSMIGRLPAGDWELALPNSDQMRNRFGNGDIQDILLVITYSGRTARWLT
ncbi:Tc toxin subunit A-related protein [Paraburkholderia terrae]|uniref:Tc toxin subunit A-related protein n=1 Tax=Paraburkholderia terrae TaxID=311230 RepID=UPI00296AEB6B|nr:neuraminidase-like domain-containing protein [Paraburkholderia terrae]MDW3660580.1 hypothetical protein [Paraburkholderia terrae]